MTNTIAILHVDLIVWILICRKNFHFNVFIYFSIWNHFSINIKWKVLTTWYFHQLFACAKSNSHVLTTHLHPFISLFYFLHYFQQFYCFGNLYAYLYILPCLFMILLFYQLLFSIITLVQLLYNQLRTWDTVAASANLIYFIFYYILIPFVTISNVFCYFHI